MKEKTVWLLAVVLLGDSAVRSVRSNFNLGVFLMYMLTALVWVYALFHRKIDAFCAAGWGRVLKILFLSGCAVFVGLMVLVGVLGSVRGAQGDEKAVIVLGAAVHGDKVSGLLARRLDAAYTFAAAHPDALVVVSGGQGPGENIPEAVAMKQYLEGKGLDGARILTEARSTSTEENFAFSRALLAQHGVQPDEPIAYVTNRFHCYRAGGYARLAGFSDVSAIPASIGLSSVLPCYMREALAVLYFWVFRR